MLRGGLATGRIRRGVTLGVALAALGGALTIPPAGATAGPDTLPPGSSEPTTEPAPTTEASTTTTVVPTTTTTTTTTTVVPTTSTTTAATSTTTTSTTSTTTGAETTEPAPLAAGEMTLFALPAAAAATTCTVSVTVRAGSTVGARCVETRLDELGLISFDPDDAFTNASVSALRAFQDSVALPASGVADRVTLEALGIWADPPAPGCTVSVTVRAGSTRGTYCVETRLRQLGWTAQVPDGFFNPASVEALRRFQRSEGLAADGVAGPATLGVLGVWNEPPAATCTVSITVRPGSVVGARCVETRLRQLGWTGQAPDDSFNPSSVAALRAFQFSEGLATDGIAGESTLQRLQLWRPTFIWACWVQFTVRPGSIVGARCVEHRLHQLGLISYSPDDMLNPASVAALRAFQFSAGLAADGIAGPATLQALRIWRLPPTPTCTVSTTVRYGSTTGARCLETRLDELGLIAFAPDDWFSRSSVNALAMYQFNVGLAADGIAGKATLQALGIWKDPPNPYPLPANSGSGRRIVYSRAQQRLWAVDALGNVVKTHRVSGRLYEPRAGTYHVYSRSLYTNSIADPSIRWRYMVRFTYGFNGGRIGFHEIPNRYGVPLQTYEQLGLPLSGGCVRQTTADALWVWNWAPIGTKVVVL